MTVPPFPVTPTKMVLFLEYETTHEKVSLSFLLLFPPLNSLVSLQHKQGSSECIPGSSVGKSVVQQVISALENWRVNHQHLHKDDPEAQMTLRSDNRIKLYETASKHNEPKRVQSSQVLKASGTSSGESADLFFQDVNAHSASAQTPTPKQSSSAARSGA